MDANSLPQMKKGPRSIKDKTVGSAITSVFAVTLLMNMRRLFVQSELSNTCVGYYAISETTLKICLDNGVNIF